MTTDKPKRKRSSYRLDDVLSCRRQASKIIRASLAGEIDTVDSGRFVNMLYIVCKMIREDDFEKRLEALENQATSTRQEGTTAT